MSDPGVPWFLAFFRDMRTNPFLLTGLVAGLLASIACGVVGPYVVTRRLVFLAGALAHIAIGGVGAAIFLAWAFPTAFGWLTALMGGTAMAVVSAPILAVLHHRVRERLDTVVGALWASGMAVGILLIKLTPGYHAELMSYLFGNLVFVGWSDIGTARRPRRRDRGHHACCSSVVSWRCASTASRPRCAGSRCSRPTPCCWC